MGLLDRFKPQPRWKHADPAVRMAGVQELPEEDQELLATIAREDEDARVRRVAVSKLGSVAALAERIRNDGDAQVREEAAGVLLDIALGAYEADETASLAAVDGLAALPAAEAQKQLVLIAKSARLESVARRALDGTGGDARALGTIARRSEHAGIRVEALGRLDDAQEIGATALKSDYKDVALAAVDRLEDPEALRAVAARAKSPAAQRRARALVRAMEEREAAAAAAEARRQAVLEARRQAQRDLCRLVEALVSPADAALAPSRLADAEARWSSFGEDLEPELARRFEDACAAARDAIAAREAEQAERDRQERERAELAARRADVCARIERLPADQVDASLDALKAEWSAMPGDPDPMLANRFDAACRGAAARSTATAEIAAAIERMQTLAADFEGIADGPQDAPPADLRSRTRSLRDEWRTLSALAGTDPRASDAVGRWMAAEERLRAHEQALRESHAREARDAAARAERAAEAIERLIDREDTTLKAVDHALRNARAADEALEKLPASPERDRARERLERARTAIAPRAHALREADDWQRWANAAVQEQLCVRMEALRSLEDPAQAVRGMRELQAEWQKVALGPREGGQALWRRFVAARDEVRTRTDAYVAEQARSRTENLQRKEALCRQAESLAESTDWIRTADAIKALQAEWKTIGPGPRRGEQALWERFRAACDRFFSRRHDDLSKRKQVWTANVALKEALCARAEALASSEDWEAAAAEFKRLQAEWKTIGPVRRSKSEALWRRFHEACDRFFERYKSRHDTDRAARLAEREALVSEIEALAGSPEPAGEGTDTLGAVRRLRARWESGPALPRDVLAPLHDRVEAALAAFAGGHPDVVRGSELDVDANVRRLESLCSRAEQLAHGDAEPSPDVSPAALLAAQLREALAANTIGGRGEAESRRARHEHDARQLQAAWEGVGFVPETVRRPLAERFRRALRRSVERADRRVPVGRG